MAVPAVTIKIDVQEVQTHLSELLNRVMQGEEITIEQSGVPVARIVSAAPAMPTPARRVEARVPGTAKVRIFMADDFDAP